MPMPVAQLEGEPCQANLRRMSFGHKMRELFELEPASIYLNHGTVGCVPRRVSQVQQRLRDEIERQPSRFLLRELTTPHVGLPRGDEPRLRRAAREVASFFSARAEDLVFTDNTTTAVNAVLRSFPFVAGDEIVIHDQAYGAIRYTVDYVARTMGCQVRVATLPVDEITPQKVVAAVEAALTPKTRVLVIDHVTSETALVLPVAEIAAVCRARGVLVLVDGAHATGAFALDIPALGVDWYTGNLHKWAWSPRSCAILWVDPAHQASVHPTTISWGLDQGMVAEFDWVGTRDPTPYLAAPEGLTLMRELGLEDVFAYNHTFAFQAGQLLSSRWSTWVPAPEAMVGTMVTMPLPEAAGSTREDAARLRDALLFEEQIEVQIHAARGRLYTRVSAQIYNELGDIERLAAAVLARLGV